MENNSYVYIYTRLDNNTIFYVGKGKDNRYKDMNSRNNHFMNIINKIPYKVEILYDNLTDQQALDLEVDTIHHLVFEEGYSIEIKGYYKPNEIKHLVNQTWGGDGTSGLKHTEEWKQEMSKRNSGENNYFYGKTHTEETRKKISEANSGKTLSEEHKQKLSVTFSGVNNPMYGKDWREGKTEEELEEIKERQTEGIKESWTNERKQEYSERMKETWTDERKQEHSERMSGKNHPQATKVICITTMKIFDTIEEGAEYYNCHQSGVSRCCNGKYKSCGKLSDGTKLVWKYLVDYLKELN